MACIAAGTAARGGARGGRHTRRPPARRGGMHQRLGEITYTRQIRAGRQARVAPQRRALVGYLPAHVAGARGQ